MNATAEKFGYPETCLWQGRAWAVLLRPQQVSLASLVLVNLSDATSFADLSPDAISEYAITLQHVERALRGFHPYDKINYLTLMMVDPHVHTHIIPRYAAPQNFEGTTFADAGWPTLPDLKSVNDVPDGVRRALKARLVQHFSQTASHAQHA